MASPIPVVTARFEDLVSVGLRKLIEDDENLELVATDVAPAALDRALEEHQPAVVLLNFGSLASPAAVHEMHKRHAQTRIMVLANRPTADECNQMLSLGATACLSKDTEARDIINAIHLASRGMHVLPRTASAMAVNGRLRRTGPELLTAREADVLELLQEGLTNDQIANALGIGKETVRTHARSIYRKFGVSSRRELVSQDGMPPREPAQRQN
jgi:DNA-binding NarL/FixJ family response regulator